MHRRDKCVRLLRFTLLGVLIGGCATAVIPGPADQTGQHVEVTTAAINGALEKRSARLAVDPRPLRIPGVQFPDSADYLRDRGTVSTGLRERLIAREIEIVDALPLQEGCSGTMVPPSARDFSGCPDELKTHLVFGLPRETVEDSVWTIKMLEIYYTPQGRGATLHDVRVILAEGKFIFADEKALIAYD